MTPEHLDAIRHKLGKAMLEHVEPVFAALSAAKAENERLFHAAKELAEYASYAEIVGGVSVNRPQIRRECDAIFAIVRERNDAEWKALQDEQDKIDAARNALGGDNG